MSTGLSISLIGGIQICLDDRQIEEFESDKSRALLAFLAVERASSHRRERLAGLLWPEYPERKARHNLSQALYSLRGALGQETRNLARSGSLPFILADQRSIQFNLKADYWLDVEQFSLGLRGCSQHQPLSDDGCRACVELQIQAVALCKGEFLAGFTLPGCATYEEWMILVREQLHRKALSSLEILAAWHQRKGRPGESRRFAQQAISLDPLWEPAYRQLMQSLWLEGSRAAALEHYESVKVLLDQELGVGPDEKTERLVKRIRADKEIISSEPVSQHNLPHALTPFVGRSGELAQLQERLSTRGSRLITLLGPGGSGKTRLAVEAARRMVDAYPDGVYLVPLSGLPSTSSLIPAVADVLDLTLQKDRDPKDQLLDFLRAKSLLLIMDSFEEILEGASLMVAILQEAPRVQILATSRVRLPVKGENLIHLEGMAFPKLDSPSAARESDAVQLFISAARRTIPDYNPDEKQLDAISRICQVVQGMPLGIILSTAWLGMYSPAEIGAEIENSLDFLSVDWPDLPQRQRSLRATMEYSWRLMEAPNRERFQALSVFRGSFTMEAAALVTGIEQKEMLSLIESSLVQRTSGRRCLIHDLLRQFAAEKLAEAPRSFDRTSQHHADYYSGLLSDWEAPLKDHHQQPTLEIMDLEQANLAAACRWVIGCADFQRLFPAINTLFRYYELRMRSQEGAELCREAIQAIEMKSGQPGHELQVTWLDIWMARFSRLLGKRQEAELYRRRSLRHLEVVDVSDPSVLETIAFLSLERGYAHYDHDRPKALDAFQESLRHYEELADSWGMAASLVELSAVTRYLDDLEGAVRLGKVGLDLYRGVGDPRGIARALNGLGQSLNRAGRWEEGEQYIQEMIDLYQSIGDQAGMAAGLLHQTRALFWFGRYERMIELADIGQEILRDLGVRRDRTFSLSLAAMARWLSGDYEGSKLIASESLALAREVDYPRMVVASLCTIGGASIGLSDYSGASAFLKPAVSLLRDLQNLDDLVLGLSILTCSQIKTGETRIASANLAELMEILTDVRGIWGASYSLPVAALYLNRDGRVEKAIEVYTLIRRYPIAGNSRFFEDVVGKEIDVAASRLPLEAVAEAEERGRQGDPFEMAAELLEEFRAAS